MILQRNFTGNMGWNGWLCTIGITAGRFPVGVAGIRTCSCYGEIKEVFRV